MLRRSFLGLLATAPIAAAAGAKSEPPYQHRGLVDASAWMAHRNSTGEYLHVYLDGRDMTVHERVKKADDVAGFVDYYQRNPVGGLGGRIAADGRLVPVRAYGRVRIIPGPPFGGK